VIDEKTMVSRGLKDDFNDTFYMDEKAFIVDISEKKKKPKKRRLQKENVVKKAREEQEVSQISLILKKPVLQRLAPVNKTSV